MGWSQKPGGTQAGSEPSVYAVCALRSRVLLRVIVDVNVHVPANVYRRSIDRLIATARGTATAQEATRPDIQEAFLTTYTAWVTPLVDDARSNQA